MSRQTIFSGTKWEQTVGYCRAIRVGNIVEVAGTTAVDEQGDVVGQADPHQQTRFILQKIDNALQKAGATLGDVVRTRMFVTDITQWEAVGRAHGEFFAGINPVATMVEVQALISPDLLVEIEVTAIIPEEV